MKIAMLSSEAVPLAKSGGLADVVYSLSKELASEGHQVLVALPFYKSIRDKAFKPKKIGTFDVYMSWRKQAADIYSLSIDGVSYYLIANAYYFDRDKMYGYDDDGERFAFFSLACRRLLKFIDFQADIVHVHDWQTAIVPCLIKEQNGYDVFYQKMKFVLTIHNPAFKGMIDRFFLNDFYGLSDALYDTGKVRFEGMVSTLKSGIVYSDKITTVSPSHREELLSPLGSQGLDGILNLRREDFVGILNGLDTAEWDPSSDKDIAFPYNAETLEKGKHENQADLLKAFGVKWYGGPVYGMVSRLSWQKGVDLVLASGKRALSQGANLLILGNGEYELEQKCENLRKAFPDTCGIFIGYNNALAHKIYAGCDYFLMPSLFEPCGLSQMIAQRYGTLPIVRYTGGLRDTVHGYLPTSCEASDGIGFNDYNEQGLDYGFALSREVSANQKLYYEMARRAMGLDRSWKKSAHDYLKLYRTLAPGE
jgi:starch synthase